MGCQILGVPTAARDRGAAQRLRTRPPNDRLNRVARPVSRTAPTLPSMRGRTRRVTKPNLQSCVPEARRCGLGTLCGKTLRRRSLTVSHQPGHRPANGPGIGGDVGRAATVGRGLVLRVDAVGSRGSQTAGHSTVAKGRCGELSLPSRRRDGLTALSGQNPLQIQAHR